MRTTVTIDADTEHLLREEVRRTGLPFKQVLNQAIRRALAGAQESQIQVEALFSEPFPDELKGINMNRLADALDDEDTLNELAR